MINPISQFLSDIKYGLSKMGTLGIRTVVWLSEVSGLKWSYTCVRDWIDMVRNNYMLINTKRFLPEDSLTVPINVVKSPRTKRVQFKIAS